MKWISVKDKLPEIDTPVLALDKDYKIMCMVIRDAIYFYKNKDIHPPLLEWKSECCCGCNDYAPVTHWMPLPEKPENI